MTASLLAVSDFTGGYGLWVVTILAVVAPNPLAVVLLSTARFARWRRSALAGAGHERKPEEESK